MFNECLLNDSILIELVSNPTAWGRQPTRASGQTRASLSCPHAGRNSGWGGAGLGLGPRPHPVQLHSHALLAAPRDRCGGGLGQREARSRVTSAPSSLGSSRASARLWPHKSRDLGHNDCLLCASVSPHLHLSHNVVKLQRNAYEGLRTEPGTELVLKAWWL